MKSFPRYGIGAPLLLIPLLIAFVGPLFVPATLARGPVFTIDDEHWLGTDFIGRDVWHQVLLGGQTVVVISIAATALAYLAGMPLALLATLAARRWLDEAIMRPLDLALAVPSLLVLILLAGITGQGGWPLVLIVAAINLPDVSRICRAAALEIANRPALEAMRLQGESWWRIAVGYVGRGMARTVAADAGTRLIGSVYLVSSASFLGIGVAPDASDWAVMVDRNRAGLFLDPWAVAVPAVLIICLCVGLNLLFDNALRKDTEVTVR